MSEESRRVFENRPHLSISRGGGVGDLSPGV